MVYNHITFTKKGVYLGMAVEYQNCNKTNSRNDRKSICLFLYVCFIFLLDHRGRGIRCEQKNIFT